jgi:hypothetical protein
MMTPFLAALEQSLRQDLNPTLELTKAFIFQFEKDDDASQHRGSGPHSES